MMISSPGSAIASSAFMKAMFPPAVTTTAFDEVSLILFSRASFSPTTSSNGGRPTTGLYLLFSGSLRNSAILAMAEGGGPYETTPCPREIVPGQLRIHSATTGMIGDCTACMRAASRMRWWGSEQFARALQGVIEV